MARAKMPLCVLLLACLMVPVKQTSAAQDHTEKSIPFKQVEEGGRAQAVKVVGAFVFVSLLGIGAIYALKKYAPLGFQREGDQNRRVKLVETLRVTPKTTLVLIELDGRPILFAQSADRVVGISGDTDPEQDKDA